MRQAPFADVSRDADEHAREIGMSRGVTAAAGAARPAVRAAGADGIVVADGTSCRHQIADQGGREAVHAVRVLDFALGG